MSSSSHAKARHPIHVAVMRLFKPPFNSETIPSSFHLRTNDDLGNTFPLTGLLKLPETPGETYLGQHFNAFVRITNTHSRPLKGVKLTVELVTPQVRHVFTDKRLKPNKNGGGGGGSSSSPPVVELAVDDGLDIVIEHLLVQQGTHRLRVTVSYVWPETGVSDTCVKQYPVVRSTTMICVVGLGRPSKDSQTVKISHISPICSWTLFFFFFFFFG